METSATCPNCQGTGHRPCRRCNGTGRSEFNPWERPFRPSDCAQCKGSGRDPDPDPVCHGTGDITIRPDADRQGVAG